MAAGKGGPAQLARIASPTFDGAGLTQTIAGKAAFTVGRQDLGGESLFSEQEEKRSREREKRESVPLRESNGEREEME